MTRAVGLLLLLIGAYSMNLGSGVERPVLAPATAMVSDGPDLDTEPRPRRPLEGSRTPGGETAFLGSAETPTTTPTVPWSSLRLEDRPVEAAVPVRIEILAIDLEAPIRPLGIARGTGLMEVPENVTEVGWYRFGPVPGHPGSAVLAAHVDMAGEGPGVFFHLDRLRVGDQVNVGYDDGTTSSFVVSQAERVPKGELNFDSVFSAAGEPLLRLITCGGDFNRTFRSYDDNVVVTAQLLRP